MSIRYIAYNQYPLDQAVTATLRFIFRIQGKTFAMPSPGARIAGTLFIALPRATGWNVPCYIPNDGGPSLLPPHALPSSCMVIGGMWGTLFLLLLLSGAIHTFKSCRALRRLEHTQPRTGKQRQVTIRYTTRLMLMAGAILTILLYINSSAPALDPWISTRYLVSLPLALPAILWPLWCAGQSTSKSLRAKCVKTFASAFLVAIPLIFILGWAQTLNLIPDAQRKQQQDAALISNLLIREGGYSR